MINEIIKISLIYFLSFTNKAINKIIYTKISEIILKSNPESDLAPDYVKQYVRYGSSPRGAQAIVLSSKINALINGRYNVSYDDVKEMSKSALRHRLILNFEAVTDGISEEEIINKITERQP